MKAIRKLYDWVLSWANSKYGSSALFALSFAEASFFPIPPDTLLIALGLGARQRSLKFALNCTVASVLGALFGYSIGYFLWWRAPDSFSPLANFFFAHIPGFTPHAFYKVKALFDQWNFWIIFTAGFTPIPFKVFTVTGGAFAVNLFMFVVAAIIGRAARFFAVAYLIWRYGERIRNFIDKYFNWLATGFAVLLIGGFLLIKYAC